MKSVSVFTKAGFFFLLLAGLRGQGEPERGVQGAVLPNLLSVKMLDASTIVAVGEDGIVLRSTDGGYSWTLSRPFGSGIYLRDLAFVDGSVGTVVGSGGLIARTLDGGLTWETQDSGTTVDLGGVSFVNADVGSAVGAEDTILRTTDGGASWVNQYGGASDTLRSVWLVDAEEGTVVGFHSYYPYRAWWVVVRTRDGGQSWTRQSEPHFGASRVAFFDRDHGIIVGMNTYFGTGAILRTDDGGENWSGAQGPRVQGQIYDVAIIGVQSAFAVAESVGLRTDDLGATWRSINLVGGNSVSFADENVGITVGQYGRIQRTEDGGEHWTWLQPIIR